MAAPPERITVKRRRDEEPVDALYIPPQKQRRTIIWNRVPVDPSPHEIHSNSFSAIGDQAQVPVVRTTLPEEDDASLLSISPAPFSHEVVATAAGRLNDDSRGVENSINIVSRRQDRHQIRSVKEHRKFHLTRTSTSSRTPSVLNGGIQKTKKTQKRKLAVFVERPKVASKFSHPGTNIASSSKEQSEPGKNKPPPSVEYSTPRKRPLASSAERNWRTQNWEQPRKSNSKMTTAVAKMHENDTMTNSIELTLQLQEFALEVSGAGHQDGQITSDDPKVKIRPKPPKLRPTKDDLATTGQDRNPSENSTDQSGFDEDSDNFVFDVYVRQPEQISEITSPDFQYSALDTANPDKVGVLVIEDEDQEMWELYGDDNQSSDDDWNSEEEDENAEGFYGNDYPEDELDSDDEYNRNAYKHWHSTFDEEAYEDSDHWSDNETSGKKGWANR